VSEIADQYDHFQDSFEELGKRRKYLNYGYASGPGQSLEDRQEQLCREVFRLAEIRPDDVVVDVGFGSGEQDFLLARHHRFRRLVGFNIAPHQVNYANRRAAACGLARRLVFHTAPAEDMRPLPASVADKVLAIECAFYFDRPRFYREAARVLRPGGRLVLADITLGPGLSFLVEHPTRFQRAGTLDRNRREWEPYFRTVLIRQINHRTRSGAQQSVFRIVGTARRLKPAQRKAWLSLALSSQLVALGLWLNLVQYHLIVLEKRPFA
jgi:ubiquinone/menaquinone biosynthesis C-methylase UbiE